VDAESIRHLVDSMAREKDSTDRAIDKRPILENPTTHGPKRDDYSHAKAGTIHDSLARNPALAAKFKKLGAMALIDF
jgi:hypothetical protein